MMIRLECQLGSILASNFLQDASKMPSRRPKMPQLGAQDGAGDAQEAPKMRQEPPKSCPRGVQEAAYRRFRAKARHKATPDSLKTSIFDHFGDDLEGYGIIWDGFLEGF